MRYLAEAREQTGLPVITEVMSPDDVELVGDYADILQVGARNTQNYSLLKALGKQSKPVFLKRGISGTIEELLMSAEYILSGGNMQVMVCERGIRTYETITRNTFDINAVPVLKSAHPSAGRRRSGPWHRPVGSGRPGRQGCRGRGRRCADDRGPPGPGQRLERRRTEPDAGAFRQGHGGLRPVARRWGGRLGVGPGLGTRDWGRGRCRNPNPQSQSPSREPP